MSMVESQILNKILDSQDISFITDNCLDGEYFPTLKDEFNFIQAHVKTYGQVPDLTTFMSNFPNFTLFPVAENDKYLLDVLKEEHTYSFMAKVINEAANIVSTNAFAGVDYLKAQLNNLSLQTGINFVDIIQQSDERLNTYKQKTLGNLNFYIPSGFPELDTVTNGWQRGEEFVVIMARLGVGKSWFLITTVTRAWEQGYNVGFISPEMTASSVGYRFDTVRAHFSNQALSWGRKVDGYDEYITDLKQNNNKFLVATPRDFNNRVTVSKLRTFVEANKLDMLAIDGISYLSDERASRGDSRTIELTHISEDLMQLSNDLGIPVLTVVQANRTATVDPNEAPDVSSIRDSDGIGFNATRVIALRQSGGSTMEFKIRKNRYGLTGGKVCYNWDAEHGNFIYLPVEDDAVNARANYNSARNTNTNTNTDNSNQPQNSHPNLLGAIKSNSFLNNNAGDVF